MTFDESLNELGKRGRFVSLLVEICSNVYDAVCLVPADYDLENWHPYKGHRDMRTAGIVCLAWAFNDEATSLNNVGELIYAPIAPEDLEEGEELQKQNWDCYREIATADLADELPEEDDVVARIASVLAGTAEPWEGAPRTDLPFTSS